MATLYDPDLLKTTQSLNLTEDDQGLCLNIETSQSTAKLSLFGCHLISFISKEDGKERLWLSEKAIFDGKTPIRGGIPVCWPWFGSYSDLHPHSNIQAPNHGFVRNQFWSLVSAKEYACEKTNTDKYKSDSQNDRVVLCLKPSSLGLFGFSPKVDLTVRIEISNTLNISLITENNSHESIVITEALHTYFAIADITNVIIQGITEPYYDKPSKTANKTCPLPYSIEQETDRIHAFDHNKYQTKQSISLLSKREPTKYLHKVEQVGHDSVVVWNPWRILSKSMKDLSDNGYQTMLCIEAANTEPLYIKPGESHKLTQIIQ